MRWFGSPGFKYLLKGSLSNETLKGSFSPSNVTDKGGAMGDERPSDITLRSSEKFDWMCDGRAEGRGGEVDSISGGSNAKIEV